MKPHYESAGVQVFHGDCLDVLRTLPDASVDAVVTDPPYGLGFMGQKWDTYANESGRRPSSKDHKFDHVGGNHNPSNAADAARTRRVEAKRFGEWCELWAAECFRVLKPGGHMLAFGGSRTWHRLAAGIEDAGFEIRDSIAWLYGSGFPKSQNVSVAIDKTLGATRTERAGVKPGHENFVGRDNMKALRESGALSQEGGYSRPWMHDPEKVEAAHYTMKPATEQAEAWEGWGTALKPAFEPVVVARKPLAGTVAGNVLQYGTGALNIGATRVQGPKPATTRGASSKASSMAGPLGAQGRIEDDGQGRWPTNVVMDESQAEALDTQSGHLHGAGTRSERVDRGPFSSGSAPLAKVNVTDGGGGASRFFPTFPMPTFRYEAKAPTSERPKAGEVQHPTVKPLDLMRWLVRLVTPAGGVVLEPFAGSGTTVEAAVLEGFQCIAIEREADYLPLIEQRLSKPMQQSLFGDWDGDAA